MSRAAPQRFERNGLLAIEPKAFFELFFSPPTPRVVARVGAVDVIEVTGPLVQRDEPGGWSDSYESIRARFREACASDSRAIVMRFDSPGGDASGVFETARALREQALAARKPLYAYVDRCCSAAYALASAATHGIVIGETCCAGSIGVLSSRPDITAANLSRGLRMAFVTSGSRKLDGNPDYPISEAELVETQRHVDGLALKFFALIEDMRPQLSAATVAGFDGGVFYGEGATAVALADQVATFEDTLARADRAIDMTPVLKEETVTSLLAKSDYDAARASLQKAAKGTDANATAARRALAAMSESEPEKKPDDEAPAPESDEPDEDEPESSDEGDDEPAATAPDASVAADDGEPDDAPPKKATAPSAPGASARAGGVRPRATSTANEVALAARVQRLEAQAVADREARTRRKLLASRPDFVPEVVAVLRNAPLDTLREACAKWPKGKTAVTASSAAGGGGAKRTTPITTVGATRSSAQLDSSEPGGVRSRLSGTAADELDRAMGFTAPKLGSKREGSTLYFGFVEAPDAAPGLEPPPAHPSAPGRSTTH